MSKLTVPIGGQRLGSGNKMNVDLRTYNRSTHDLGYVWRNTQAPGTLVPFMSIVGLPGDTFDINLGADVKTHPTVGPLFGSYKLQLDVFTCPIRLYHSWLHNNKLEIGLKMNTVKLPKLRFQTNLSDPANDDDFTNANTQQISPSSLLHYIGFRGGAGVNPEDAHPENKYVEKINAIPYLAYWDIYKQYYANKQEEEAYMIHSSTGAVQPKINTLIIKQISGVVNQSLTFQNGELPSAINLSEPDYLFEFTGTHIDPANILLTGIFSGETVTKIPAGNLMEIVGIEVIDYPLIKVILSVKTLLQGGDTLMSIDYKFDPYRDGIGLYSFPLKNIDRMREDILSHNGSEEFLIEPETYAPYGEPIKTLDSNSGSIFSRLPQEGLGIKTYQSDIFNNWINTDWIDGENGINAITAIDTSEGSFQLDTLNLAKKVYDMLNRIAISGGTYKDWLNTVWPHNGMWLAESPIYEGGLSKEIVFQEVTSNSASESSNGEEPLGTLAGRGAMGNKHKGGSMIIKVNEPSYIIGIVSITPRVDYSQGNNWDLRLDTLDDLHKPALDGIGFQELITEQMVAADRQLDLNGDFKIYSAGKQPAWLNYMTAINRVAGNFAVPNNEDFMVLNRNYRRNPQNGRIRDLTTYIDPSNSNPVFATSDINSMNFWVQIGCDITARRIMSAKIIPNL